jgi:hypothetical protein
MNTESAIKLIKLFIIINTMIDDRKIQTSAAQDIESYSLKMHQNFQKIVKNANAERNEIIKLGKAKHRKAILTALVCG